MLLDEKASRHAATYASRHISVGLLGFGQRRRGLLLGQLFLLGLCRLLGAFALVLPHLLRFCFTGVSLLNTKMSPPHHS